MNTSITLDDRHYTAVAKKARELGTTPELYIHSLIDAATQTFDDILEPARRGFARDGVTEDELDDAVNSARKAIYEQSKRDGIE